MLGYRNFSISDFQTLADLYIILPFTHRPVLWWSLHCYGCSGISSGSLVAGRCQTAFSYPCCMIQNKLRKKIIADDHYEISFYSLLGTEVKPAMAQPLF